MKRKLDKNYFQRFLEVSLESVGEGARKERKDERRKIIEKKEGERDSTEREREIERK